jgi:hypothetical protein
MARLIAPLGIRWLRAVLSRDCRLKAPTRLVLAGVFTIIDWESGKNYFESVRALAARVGLGKDAVAKHLTIAVEKGYLTRTPRAAKGDPTRRGFNYALRLPAVSSQIGQTGGLISVRVSDRAGQRDGSLSPISLTSVSIGKGPCVHRRRTDSPSESPFTHRSATTRGEVSRRKPSLRDALISAARRSHERRAFEADFPNALEPLRRIGGWRRLGDSNEQRELPGLVAQVVAGVREGCDEPRGSSQMSVSEGRVGDGQRV